MERLIKISGNMGMYKMCMCGELYARACSILLCARASFRLSLGLVLVRAYAYIYIYVYIITYTLEDCNSGDYFRAIFIIMKFRI